MKWEWLTVPVLIAAGACAAPAGPKTIPGFVDTTWQLHAIQSMDDSQGTTRITESERYTVRFAANGQASFRFDCNRGMGTWKAAAAADGVSGNLSFGPVVITRALCPPPRLDERVARDLAYVRGYLFKDGKLYMSLMADGGIYEWHRVATPEQP